MATAFRCTIVTPDALAFEGDVEYASLPAWDGQLGVMSSQSPLLTKLDVGVLRLDAGGTSHRFMVDRGIAQVQDNTLTLITESCLSGDDVDRAAVEKELAEANARVSEQGEDQPEVEMAQKRARAKLALLQA